MLRQNAVSLHLGMDAVRNDQMLRRPWKVRVYLKIIGRG